MAACQRVTLMRSPVTVGTEQVPTARARSNVSLAGPGLVIVATYGVCWLFRRWADAMVTPLPATLTGTVTTLRTAKLATRLTAMFCVRCWRWRAARG